MDSPSRPVVPDLPSLTRLFYPSIEALGEFAEEAIDEMPPGYRRLLAHNEHMTVTVEQFHGCPVDVRVLDRRTTPTHYARKILLTRQSDGRVVQFGIMRVHFASLPEAVRREIESEATPLGRILIEHDIHRRVQLFSLRRVRMGDELRQLFGQAGAAETHGRTALIECNSAPAIELLEIVAPLEDAE
jgi:chorismate-pyruvate lyase